MSVPLPVRPLGSVDSDPLTPIITLPSQPNPCPIAVGDPSPPPPPSTGLGRCVGCIANKHTVRRLPSGARLFLAALHNALPRLIISSGPASCLVAFKYPAACHLPQSADFLPIVLVRTSHPATHLHDTDDP
ncbi:hypothetical protein MN608_07678 [Microdochium nivale]|nr:hypothetical protein MN608_07678 [Microdochium nivale]